MVLGQTMIKAVEISSWASPAKARCTDLRASRSIDPFRHATGRQLQHLTAALELEGRADRGGTRCHEALHQDHQESDGRPLLTTSALQIILGILGI
jgi:hypothetical protein